MCCQGVGSDGGADSARVLQPVYHKKTRRIHGVKHAAETLTWYIGIRFLGFPMPRKRKKAVLEMTTRIALKDVQDAIYVAWDQYLDKIPQPFSVQIDGQPVPIACACIGMDLLYWGFPDTHQLAEQDIKNLEAWWDHLSRGGSVSSRGNENGNGSVVNAVYRDRVSFIFNVPVADARPNGSS